MPYSEQLLVEPTSYQQQRILALMLSFKYEKAGLSVAQAFLRTLSDAFFIKTFADMEKDPPSYDFDIVAVVDELKAGLDTLGHQELVWLESVILFMFSDDPLVMGSIQYRSFKFAEDGDYAAYRFRDIYRYSRRGTKHLQGRSPADLYDLDSEPEPAVVMAATTQDTFLELHFSPFFGDLLHYVHTSPVNSLMTQLVGATDYARLLHYVAKNKATKPAEAPLILLTKTHPKLALLMARTFEYYIHAMEIQVIVPGIHSPTALQSLLITTDNVPYYFSRQVTGFSPSDLQPNQVVEEFESEDGVVEKIDFSTVTQKQVLVESFAPLAAQIDRLPMIEQRIEQLVQELQTKYQVPDPIVASRKFVLQQSLDGLITEYQQLQEDNGDPTPPDELAASTPE